MIGNDCVNHSVSDRDCSHCIWHTSGQCANWNCEPVSRKEALEALEKVKAMESAQPIHSNTPNTLETLDCISRKDAIAEIARWIGYLDKDMISRIQIGLKRLPSAQPEIIRCKECMNHGKEICYFWSHFYGTINTPDDGFCHKAERRTDD